MKGNIFLIQGNGQLVEMEEQAYDSEDMLQRLLAEYPNLLAGSQIDKDAPRRWLLISREAPIPSSESGSGRWSVDHLFLDQDAIPTLVEVKRSSDTRIRREVIGQMMDYAANAVVYWPAETIQLNFKTRCVKAGMDPDALISDFLQEDLGEDQFWENLKTNLKTGKIRMLFVADEIPSELQRIIEFLNIQMNPAEVLGVEVKQFIGQNLRTLVPRIIGQTIEAKDMKGGGKKLWSEDIFLEEMKTKVGSPEAEIAARFLEWGRSGMMTPRWGRGKLSGSYSLYLNHNEKEHKILSISTEGKGKLWFQFGDYMKQPPFDSKENRAEFLRHLNAVPGISISEEVLTAGKYPNVPLSVFLSALAYDKTIEAFDWFIGKIRNS